VCGKPPPGPDKRNEDRGLQPDRERAQDWQSSVGKAFTGGEVGISKIKKKYNHMPSTISSDTFIRYGEFIRKSKIHRKVLTPEEEFMQHFPSSRVDKALFNLVGTQSEMSLEEEKREIRKIIWERMRA